MFEIHITISPIEEKNQPLFIEICKKLDAKPVIIELREGEVLQQPMISKILKGITSGTLKYEVDFLVEQIRNYGYDVARVKVEVPLEFMEQGIAEFPDYKGQYFEWHGKVQSDNFNELEKKLDNRDVHLSRNSLKNQPDRKFLTIRTPYYEYEFMNKVGNLKSYLLNTLKDIAILLKDEYEYCIYDSNKSLDKGWIDTPEITDKEYIELLIFEGFLRRASQIQSKFLLKGSLLTRQYFADKEARRVDDLDFLCVENLKDKEEAANFFSNWVTRVTELSGNDEIRFRSFRENDFWRRIDYAMNDDFPTVNTDLLVHINNQIEEEISLDISWNLPLGGEPVTMLYYPLKGEPFPILSIPLSTQISWKLHQSIVRPRAKDLIDIILLLENNNLSEKQLQDIVNCYKVECQKDKINPNRILHYLDGAVLKHANMNYLELIESWSHYKDKKTNFGFDLGHDLSLNKHNRGRYTNILDVFNDFEGILRKSGISDTIKNASNVS